MFTQKDGLATLAGDKNVIKNNPRALDDFIQMW